MITDIAQLTSGLTKALPVQEVFCAVTPADIRKLVETLQEMVNKGTDQVVFRPPIGNTLVLFQCCETIVEQVAKVGKGSARDEPSGQEDS